VAGRNAKALELGKLASVPYPLAGAMRRPGHRPRRFWPRRLPLRTGAATGDGQTKTVSVVNGSCTPVGRAHAPANGRDGDSWGKHPETRATVEGRPGCWQWLISKWPTFLRSRHRPARRRAAGVTGHGWTVGVGRRLTVDGGLTDQGPPATDTRPPILTDHSPRTTGSPSVGGFRTEAACDLVSNFRGRIPRLHQTERVNGVRAGGAGRIRGRWAVDWPTTVTRRPIPTDHEPAVHRRETWTGSGCNPQPTAPPGSAGGGFQPDALPRPPWKEPP